MIGNGTVVDSLRFRELLAQQLEVHSDDLRAYIIGEHGESQLAVFSSAEAGGEAIDRTPERERMFEIAKSGGIEVFHLKGHTNFAVSIAAAYVLEAIAFDNRRVIPVSVAVDGFHGVRGVCLSLPAVIGRTGVQRVLQPRLNHEEIAAWRQSADSVRQTLERMRRVADEAK